MRISHIVGLVLLTVASACGGGDYSAPTTPTGGGEANPPPPGSPLAQVTIQDFSFGPSSLTVKAGTVVRWTNQGPSAHTSVSDSGIWGSGTLGGPTSGGGYGDSKSAGGIFDFTFTEPGTYPYHCSLHPPSSYPNFTGTITVTP